MTFVELIIFVGLVALVSKVFGPYINNKFFGDK